jgi:hypothetical protein
MERIKVFLDTDWWMFFASISSGVFAAIATLIAVWLTNRETRKQLRQQKEQHEREIDLQNKANKLVIIKPTIMLSSFVGLLDRIIVQNNYNRELLISGEDGFEFFDNPEKRQKQMCRILHIENTSDCNIMDIIISTMSCLEDRNTNELKKYETKNVIKLLRSRESIDIRLANQEQYESIIRMNQERIPNEFKFECRVEYSTQADQRITYCYIAKISNDRCIEIEKDEIEKVENVGKTEVYNSTVFRNLQDYINIDRASYIWEKMGQSQARGLISLVGLGAVQLGNNIIEAEEKEGEKTE